MVKLITILLILLYASVSDGQVNQGTVFSKTEDGNGNKITSTVVGPDRALHIYCLGGTCGSGGVSYLDADGIANQTTTAMHGQMYMYNGVTWDRVRGSIAGGLQVNCITGCAGGASTPTDAFANPTTAGLQMGFLMGWNGATWDRLRSSIANGLVVDVSRVQGSVAVTNAGLTNLDVLLSTRLADATFTGRFAAAYLDADAIANQTTTAMHGNCYLYNGATWDRCRGSIAGGMLVNISNATLAVTQSGAWSTGRTWTLSSGTDSVTATVSNAFLLDATFTGRFTAATLDADAIANETTTAVHGKCYLYNGATWDRCRGSIASGLLVNISNATLAVTQSGTWNIGTLTSITNTVTVQGTKTNNNAAPGATNVGTLPCVATAAAPSYTEGNQVGCSTNLGGAQRVIEQNFISTANNDGACPSGAANFTVAASNVSRTWLAMWASPANTDDVYVKLGVTATTSDARLAPGQTINFTTGRIYTGQVDAIPASGTQAVCLMELN